MQLSIGFVVDINASCVRLSNVGPTRVLPEERFRQYREELKKDFGDKGYFEWDIPVTEIEGYNFLSII